jgi:E3 ubiquitin-protein ligase SHPRH
MSQILDHLIEDAKLKAEEAQRIFVLHSNSIAALYRLRSQSNSRGAIIDSDDEISLLKKSVSVYQHTLKIAESNSCPSATVGDAILSGSNGFNSQSIGVRDGSADLIWKMWLADDKGAIPETWVKFDFSQKKRINAIAIRPIVSNAAFSSDSSASIVYPKDCVLQVSNPVCSGMFVDTLIFQIPFPTEKNESELEWKQFEGFGPEKSKIWRIVVKSFHEDTRIARKKSCSETLRIFTGLQVQLMEPDIELDTLQRLHILHNAAVVLSELSSKLGDDHTKCDQGQYSKEVVRDEISQMDQERISLERHQTEAKQVLQRSAQVRLDEVTKHRLELMKELSSGNGTTVQETANEVVPWYQELLSSLVICSDTRLQNALVAFVEDALFELFNTPTVSFGNRRTFPIIKSFSGFQMALQMRLGSNPFYSKLGNTNHNEVFVCIKAISNLGDTPSEGELYENSKCHKCRADWNQTGPKCRYCKLEEQLTEYEAKVKDEEISCIHQALGDWTKRNINPLQRTAGQYIDMKKLVKSIDKFFEFHSTVVKEISIARSKWRTHLDLLSRLDELNSCKTTRRLAYEGEDWNPDQGLVIHARDIPALLMDDSAKQAMAEGTLRKNKELLRFLKNQNIEQKFIASNSSEGDLRNICSICLEKFTSERAVLRCGHMYHYKPCLERLLTRGGHNTIVCPMRCAIRTKREDLLIASDIRKDDGSKLQQKIEGSWGTKVDRLVSDLITVAQKGEKSIVFSQWLDMIDIVEAALQINSIQYIRPKSIKRFGECLDSFRSTSCHVLLMDIKHGAEGLTIVEANHVFMIEPLLNHSMDSQGAWFLSFSCMMFRKHDLIFPY